MHLCPCSAEHRGVQLVHPSDDIRRQASALSRTLDRIRVVGLVKAIGLALVGTQERDDPADLFIVVDPLDVRGSLGSHFQLLGKIAFDNEFWQRNFPLGWTTWIDQGSRKQFVRAAFR